MVLFFTGILALSLIGMLSLLGIKHYELVSGKVVLAPVRPSVGAFLHQMRTWVVHVLPALLSTSLEEMRQWLRAALHRGIAQSILMVEYTLEKVLHIVREKTTPTTRAQGEVSPFLREVADHKKKLMRRSRERRSIVEE